MLPRWSGRGGTQYAPAPLPSSPVRARSDSGPEVKGRADFTAPLGICGGCRLRVDGLEVVGEHIGARWLLDVQDHVRVGQGDEITFQLPLGHTAAELGVGRRNRRRERDLPVARCDVCLEPVAVCVTGGWPGATLPPLFWQTCVAVTESAVRNAPPWGHYPARRPSRCRSGRWLPTWCSSGCRRSAGFGPGRPGRAGPVPAASPA